MTDFDDKFAALRHLVDAAAAHTANYTVGFVVESGEDANTNANLAGSGTLVQYLDIYGILTADHCIKNFSDRDRLGLITMHGMKLHRFILKNDTYELRSIAPWSDDRKEPDLGFVRLSSKDVSTIKATKSFFNLKLAEERIIINPPPPSECFWGVAGVIDEWTSDEPYAKGSGHVKVFGGMCGVGVLGRRYEVEDYDFVEFEIEYGEGYEGPEDYKGISGGGLWRFGVETTTNGKKVLGRCTLRGVAFYQSDLEKNKRVITCHAEQSIYGKVLEELRAIASYT